MREQRQSRYHQARMAKGRAQMQAAQQAEVANEVHLVQAPQALLKQQRDAEKPPQKLRIPAEPLQQQTVQMAE